MVRCSSCARGEQRAHTLAGQGPAYSRGRDPCARRAEGWGSHPKRPAGFGLIEDALNRPTLRAIEGAVGVEDFDHALIVDAAKYDKVADRGKIAGMHAANDWTSTGERVLDALARGMNLRGLNAQHVGPACHERPFGRTRGGKVVLVGKCGHARGVHVGSPGKAYVYHGEARWPARVDAHRSAGVWLVGPCGVGLIQVGQGALLPLRTRGRCR